jgi:hypothetical protein
VKKRSVDGAMKKGSRKGKANACLARELCRKKLQDQSKTYSNSSISAINSTTKQKG